MHHTLLPIPERKKLRLEYRIRTLIVLCFMASVAGLVGIAVLVPSFVRAMSEEHDQLGIVSALQEDKKDSGESAIESSLVSNQAILTGVASAPDEQPLSSVVESLVSAKGPLSLTSLSIERAGTGGFSVVLEGVAPTRDDLIAFKTRLEALAPGNKVDLPISELAQSTDIKFSVQLIEQLP